MGADGQCRQYREQGGLCHVQWLRVVPLSRADGVA